MKKFFYSTLQNFGAFGISGLVQLFGVSLVVSHFGLAGQGILSMLRLCLPASLPSIMDASVGETAALGVAKARANGNWDAVRHTLRALLLLGFAAGTLVGLLLYLIAMIGSQYFHLSHEYVLILVASAVLFPFFFVALIGEGILKGFERYGTLRISEIVIAVAVAFSPLLPFVTDILMVAWLQLGLFALRSLILMGFAYDEIRKKIRMPVGLEWEGIVSVWPDVQRRAFNGVGTKALSAADMRAQPLLITPIWGVEAAGLFDLLGKMPLLLKTVAGLLNQAVMPAAVRVDVKGDHDRFNRIIVVGIILIACIVWPALSAFAIAGERFLYLWMGPAIAENSIFMLTMLLVPASTVLVGFIAQALFSRFDFAKLYLSIHVRQVALNYCAALIFSVWFGANAFLLCLGIGWMVALPLYLKHASSVIGIDASLFFLPLVRLGVVCLITVIIGRSVPFMDNVDTWASWIIYSGALVIILYLISWLVLPLKIRNEIKYYVSLRISK